MPDERYAPPAMPSGAVQRRLPASLREHRSFRLLFCGQALSVLGDRITPVAIAFAVLGLGSATDLGLVLAAGGIPFALFALAGGVWADRVGRRRVMLASDIVRAASQTVTAALLLTGTAEVWMLAVLAFVYGTAAAVFMPALIGLIPQTVSQAQLQEANGLLALTRSIASVAGPAVAGVIVVAAGSGEAIAVDAATFAVSALFLARMRPRAEPVAVEAPRERERFLAGLRDGWHEVRSRTWLMWGLIAMSVYHVFVLPAVFVLGPALADRQLDGASSWAAIVACFGIGGVLGNVVALRIPLRRPVFIAALALVGASTQAAIIGVGPWHLRDLGPRAARRRVRRALLHPLGPEHPGADPAPRGLARQRLRLQRVHGPDAAWDGGVRADRRRRRPAGDPAGHERDRPRRRAGLAGAALGAAPAPAGARGAGRADPRRGHRAVGRPWRARRRRSAPAGASGRRSSQRRDAAREAR